MKLFTLFLFASITLFSHAGQVYKWTDADGKSHFSQFPPTENPQTEHININTPKASSNNNNASKNLKDMRQKLLESSVDRNTTSEKDKEAALEAERLAENCKRAQQHLRDLQNNGRIYKTLENGERHWYDEKERDALIAGAQKQADEFCK